MQTMTGRLSPLRKSTVRFYGSLLLLHMALLFILYNSTIGYQSNLMDLRMNEAKRMVELAMGLIQPTLDELTGAKISRKEAVEQVRNIVRRMTYRSESMDNYLFMIDYQGHMLVQPFEPEIEGANQWDVRDVRGNYYIRNLVDTARSKEKEGHVIYYMPFPASTDGGRKLSYVRGLDELGVCIGTGLYFTDLIGLTRKYMIYPLIIVILTIAMITLVHITLLNPLEKCFDILLQTFNTIHEDPYARPKIFIEQFNKNSDEYEILSGFADMQTALETNQLALRARAERLQDEIRERIRMEEALRQSEERYRSLYEESTGVRILINPQGTILDVNASFAREIGFSKDDLVGAALVTLAVPASWASVSLILEKVFSETYTHAMDIDIFDRNGEIRTILFSHSLLIRQADSEIYALITGVDISNRKKAERQAAVQKEQLVMADKLASLGVLVTGMAHEINNPNQFILFNANLLAELFPRIMESLEEELEHPEDLLVNGSPLPAAWERLKESVGNIEKGSRRINRLIIDLKSFASPDNPGEYTRVDAAALVESALNLCGNLIKKSTADFRLQLPEVPLKLWARQQRLEQVLINLIQNACQALTSREQAITLRVYGLPEKDQCIIEVQDEGEGISKENLSRITDPFYTTKRNTGGTGLGLSISIGIIQEHQGTMDFFSESGKGTLVKIALPLTQAPPKEQEADESS